MSGNFLYFSLQEDARQSIAASIAERSPCGVLRIKRTPDSSYVLYANDAFFTLRGYSKSDFLAQVKDSVSKFIHPDDEYIIAEAVNSACKDGSNSCTVQVRVIRADGEIKWISCGCTIQHADEEYTIDIIENDITAQKCIERELAFKEQSLEVAFGQSNAVVCELDLAARTIRASNAMRLRFDLPDSIHNVPYTLFECGFIPDMYYEEVCRMHDALYAGAPFSSCNLRLRNRNGDYVWTMVRYISIFDDEGWPSKALGVFTDIQDEVLAREASARDPLTGIFRRNALEAEARAALGQSRHVAVLILDIDRFKLVNDHFGHMAGDNVLKCFAEVLQACLPTQSIVGRLGGDEFMACVPDVEMPDLDAMLDALLAGIRDMHARYALPCPITSSIGAACFPEHGATLEELYKHADEAQYSVKKRAKNGWCIYSPETPRPFDKEG